MALQIRCLALCPQGTRLSPSAEFSTCYGRCYRHVERFGCRAVLRIVGDKYAVGHYGCNVMADALSLVAHYDYSVWCKRMSVDVLPVKECSVDWYRLPGCFREE